MSKDDLKQAHFDIFHSKFHEDTNKSIEVGLEVERPILKKGPNWEFEEWKALMLSSAKCDEIPELHFLNGNPKPFKDKIVLASYPRCGNTMTRANLEKVMGIPTGSDGNINLKLILELMEKGLPGEGLVDDRVWISKTHYPERYSSSRFGANRAILAVRSPLDCITSLFHMIASGTHDCSIEEADFEKNATFWDEWIKQESAIYHEFHEYWIK